MEKHHVELIEKYTATHSDLKELWEEHQLYSKQVEKLENKPYRAPPEEQTLKQLKKQKLEGKTQIMGIVDTILAQEK